MHSYFDAQGIPADARVADASKQRICGSNTEIARLPSTYGAWPAQARLAPLIITR